MPYRSASGSQTITVLAVTLGLSITPSPPWNRGQTITMKAVAKQDTTPIVGTVIAFWLVEPTNVVLGSAVTDSTGTATFDYTISDALGCYTVGFKAYRGATGTWSNIVRGAVAFPTRLSISAPSTISPGESFTISGKLEYEASSGVWGGIANKTVSLSYDTTDLGTAVTDSYGAYSKSVSIPTTGTKTLKASWPGEGLYLPAFTLLGVSVEVPTEIAQYVLNALGIAPALTVLATIVANEIARRR